MKKYISPETKIFSVNTLDIMSTSSLEGGADPYLSAQDWRDAIDKLEQK